MKINNNNKKVKYYVLTELEPREKTQLRQFFSVNISTSPFPLDLSGKSL